MSVVIEHKALATNKPIKKILVIRLQATGDVILTLPYLQDLKNKLPNVKIDMLVRKETEEIPKHLTIFNKVYALAGERNTKKQFLFFLLLLPQLFFKRYDVLIDLQNHRLTKWMRILLRIKVYSIFDKTSSNYAGNRYMNTINALQIVPVAFSKLVGLQKTNVPCLLQKFNLTTSGNYIVINPAGAFENRNWNLDNYLSLCLLWNKNINPNAQFIILGIDKISEKAMYLKKKLGNQLINLVGKTTLVEAIYILKQAQLIISEDSGLMHLAYVVGTPTVGILGSSRSDWLNPKLPHTYFFTSDNLPCGNCMLEKCLYSEMVCLTSIMPQQVINQSVKLLANYSSKYNG